MKVHKRNQHMSKEEKLWRLEMFKCNTCDKRYLTKPYWQGIQKAMVIGYISVKSVILDAKQKRPYEPTEETNIQESSKSSSQKKKCKKREKILV